MTNQATATPMTIRLGNEDFQLTRKRVPVDFLKLDAANQRLGFRVAQWIKQGKVTTDADLHAALWDLDTTKDLYQSVLQNGGLIEDPIVRRNGTVAEGNCRTVVMRELHKKYPKDERWKELFVQLLPDGVTEEQLVTLVGELHIAGKVRWRAYEEAEYVWKMNKVYGKTYDFLASHLRWSRTKLSQKIAAYEETKIYLEETGDPQGLNRFSHFEEFMKKRELRARAETDPKAMGQFRKWVFSGKFPDSKDVRQLPEVLANNDSYQTFLKKGIQEAVGVLNQADPTRSSDLYYSVKMASEQLRNTPLVEVNALRNGDKTKLNSLRDLRSALDELAEMAGVDL